MRLKRLALACVAQKKSQSLVVKVEFCASQLQRPTGGVKPAWAVARLDMFFPEKVELTKLCMHQKNATKLLLD
jgi:hypothetical protein